MSYKPDLSQESYVWTTHVVPLKNVACIKFYFVLCVFFSSPLWTLVCYSHCKNSRWIMEWALFKSFTPTMKRSMFHCMLRGTSVPQRSVLLRTELPQETPRDVLVRSLSASSRSNAAVWNVEDFGLELVLKTLNSSSHQNVKSYEEKEKKSAKTNSLAFNFSNWNWLNSTGWEACFFFFLLAFAILISQIPFSWCISH